jgi:hypothetical protein
MAKRLNRAGFTGRLNRSLVTLCFARLLASPMLSLSQQSCSGMAVERRSVAEIRALFQGFPSHSPGHLLTRSSAVAVARYRMIDGNLAIAHNSVYYER